LATVGSTYAADGQELEWVEGDTHESILQSRGTLVVPRPYPHEIGMKL
jgi:hypothetical protein